MKTLIFLILFLCIYNLHSQGWQWQNPLPFGDAIQKVYFVDDQNGWMIPQNPTLLRTTDGGQNWIINHVDILFNDIHFINELEGWGIGRPQFVPEIKRNIYNTLDGGLSWEIQLADTNVYHDIFFINNLYGWATSDGDLFHTHDGGNSWEKQAEGEFRPVDIVTGVTFLDTLKGWAVGGLLWGIRTYDGGQTWQKDSSLAGLIQIIYTDTLHLWGYSGNRFVRRSTDSGDSWGWHAFTDSLDGSIFDLIALNNNDLFAVTNYGIYSSSDGGETWSFRSGELMNSVAFLNTQEAWGGGIGVTKAGLFHSSNGGFTWNNLVSTNNPFGYEGYIAVDFVDPYIGWIIGNLPSHLNDNFVLKTTDGGQNWYEQQNNTNNDLTNLTFLDQNHGWMVGRNGVILNTTDGGENWVLQNSGTNLPLNAVDFTDHLKGWTVGGDITGNGAEGIILRTTNSGQEWTNITPFTVPRLFGVSFVDSLHGWVIGGGGSLYDFGIILHTSDGGDNWIVQRQNPELNLRDVEFVDSTNGWAVGYDFETDGQIIHTSDGGLTWQSQFQNDNVSPWDIKALNRSLAWICGTHGDIYNTDDGGVTWNRQQSYSVQWLRSLDFITESFGWVVGWNGTILSTTSGGASSIKQREYTSDYPQRFILYPNYPNPFNPGTIISFKILDSRSAINLSIFDIIGRKVRDLFYGELNSGEHVFKWDGNDEKGTEVPSGIYLCRFEIDNYVMVKKMLKLR